MISNPEQVPVQQPGEDVEWKRAHPAFMATALLRNLRGFIFPLVIVLLGDQGRGSRTGSLIFFAISAAILLLSGVVGIIQWRVYRYALTPERLLVNSGLIFKQERAIPYQRIQTVNLEEAPLDRLFGVSRMKIETAAGGSGESEVELKAVKRSDALALRERLLRARSEHGLAETLAGVATDGESLPEPMTAGDLVSSGELIRKLTTGELLLAGATSGTIGPALAIVGIGVQFADDIVPQRWWNRVPWDEVSGASTNLRVVAALILIVAVFAWVLAIAGTVLTYYGFELRRDGEHLVVQYGLLDRKRTTIPVRRIQAVRVEESLLRQPFRYATVRYESAGRAGSEEGGSGVLFPMLPRRTVEPLMREVAPEFAVDVDRPRLERLPQRALPRYIVGSTVSVGIVVAIVMIGVWYWRDGLPWWGYLPLVWPPLEIVFGWLGWRDAGWFLDERVLVLRTRGAARALMIAPRRRIQHRGMTANPLQRRVNLATLQVAVASGGAGGHYHLRHLDAATATAIILDLKPGTAHPTESRR